MTVVLQTTDSQFLKVSSYSRVILKNRHKLLRDQTKSVSGLGHSNETVACFLESYECRHQAKTFGPSHQLV